jgi:hypothetical protein
MPVIKTNATYEDLVEVPDNLVAEIVDRKPAHEPAARVATHAGAVVAPARRCAWRGRGHSRRALRSPSRWSWSPSGTRPDIDLDLLIADRSTKDQRNSRLREDADRP